MKAKSVLVCVVLVAAVSLAGCISKTGTGTGDALVRPNKALDVAVENAAMKPAAKGLETQAK